jgi:hypothetical protein
VLEAEATNLIQERESAFACLTTSAFEELNPLSLACAHWRGKRKRRLMNCITCQLVKLTHIHGERMNKSLIKNRANESFIAVTSHLISLFLGCILPYACRNVASCCKSKSESIEIRTTPTFECLFIVALFSARSLPLIEAR